MRMVLSLSIPVLLYSSQCDRCQIEGERENRKKR
jgi:hypothetical protein